MIINITINLKKCIALLWTNLATYTIHKSSLLHTLVKKYHFSMHHHTHQKGNFFCTTIEKSYFQYKCTKWNFFKESLLGARGQVHLAEWVGQFVKWMKQVQQGTQVEPNCPSFPKEQVKVSLCTQVSNNFFLWVQKKPRSMGKAWHPQLH